jgi:DNA-3-methyladenine glycosylase
MALLSKQFYQNEDVLKVAKALIGKTLVTNFEGIRTSGIIVETEAYRGEDDRASHAFPMKKTERTKTMFLEGGHSYIYVMDCITCLMWLQVQGVFQTLY